MRGEANHKGGELGFCRGKINVLVLLRNREEEVTKKARGKARGT